MVPMIKRTHAMTSAMNIPPMSAPRNPRDGSSPEKSSSLIRVKNERPPMVTNTMAAAAIMAMRMQTK